MNIKGIKSAIKFVQKTCKCVNCKKPYLLEDINIIASTWDEVLMELQCPTCETSLIVSVISSEENINETQGTLSRITQNDILDIKNFLTKFDGNFKKIFNIKK